MLAKFFPDFFGSRLVADAVGADPPAVDVAVGYHVAVGAEVVPAAVDLLPGGVCVPAGGVFEPPSGGIAFPCGGTFVFPGATSGEPAAVAPAA